MLDHNSFDAALKSHQERLIDAAATLYAVQKIQGDAVREQSHAAYGKILDAHMLVAGVLGSALLRANGKILPMDSDKDQRTALFASFIIGVSICEDAIAEGRYLQAHALLRQEMETIAQLKAVRSGRRKSKGSPNVTSLGESLARMYGSLSIATHLSHHSVMSMATHWEEADLTDAPNGTKATRQFPLLDKDASRRAFGLHVFLMMQLIEEMSLEFGQDPETAFTKADAEAMELAVEILALEGMVERQEDA
ncbi:hypothetical protein [Phyllobacterium sp. SB3]|uniref:hypothetical protein n=1 Tax=Phyllobacterium sp. SB3 TaxID=3156073 RepID=UPI0032B022FC